MLQGQLYAAAITFHTADDMHNACLLPQQVNYAAADFFAPLQALEAVSIMHPQHHLYDLLGGFMLRTTPKPLELK